MGKTREKKDIVEKDFVAFPDIAADVINVLLYQGEMVTKAGNLLSGPTETIYQGVEKLRAQYEDLCKYELTDGRVNIMYLIANQSRIDEKMLLRKAALIRMIKVLSGETDTGDVEMWMAEQRKEFPLFKICFGKAWIRSSSAELPDAP